MPNDMLSQALAVFDQKCVTKDPSFMNKTCIGPMLTKNKAKKLRREEAGKTCGPNWFNMPATELSDSLKNDISLVNMRDAIGATSFYKRNSGLKNAKFVQVGTILPSPADFYSDLPRRMRKRTLVEELRSDVESRSWQKKKFNEILAKDPYYLRQKRRQEAKKEKTRKEMLQQLKSGTGTDDTVIPSDRKVHKKLIKRQAKHNVFRKK